ncbi:MAG: hypothetical protein ACO3JL_10805, partial [Myxococcota bacterium]
MEIYGPILGVGMLTVLLGGCIPVVHTEALVPAHKIQIRIEAGDGSWNGFRVDPEGPLTSVGRSLRVTYGDRVEITFYSERFISTLNIPRFGVHEFAAPGLPASIRFTADKLGRFDVVGEELCGRPHLDDVHGHIIVSDKPAVAATGFSVQVLGPTGE